MADSNGMVANIDCSSDSTTPYTGRWIAPTGVDITNTTTDPFDVTVGDASDPGSLIIQQRVGHIITRSFEGVYTCALQDINGVLTYLSMGIYQNGFNSKLHLFLKTV